MLDVHCHLLKEYFSNQLDSIKTEIKKHDIKCIIVTEHLEQFDELLESVQNRQDLIPFAGLHPIQPHGSITMNDYAFAEPKLRYLLEQKQIKGIGEVGLDFSPHVVSTQEQKQEQINVFKKQLELALEFDVFVNVHSRQAGHYCIDLIKLVGNTKVIMHAFDGKLKYVVQCKDLPWFFSIPGSIQRNEKTREMAKMLPLHQMLLESDAPALGPRKEEKATPLDLLETLTVVANLRGISPQQLNEIIGLNNQVILKSIT
jgi:TatD DNase family protein